MNQRECGYDEVATKSKFKGIKGVR